MENEQSYAAADEGRSSRRGRLMGKLFGAKDRKAAENTTSLDAFLSSADSLSVTHPPPPPPPDALPRLAKLDISSGISRFPQALAVNQEAQQNRPLAPDRLDLTKGRPDLAPGRPEPRSPRRARPNKKVSFVDSRPEVIGEGGDGSETSVMEMAKQKPAKQAPAPPPHRLSMPSPSRLPATFEAAFSSAADFEPKPKPQDALPRQREQRLLVPGRAMSTRVLGADRHNDDRKSFIEMHQAQMAQAEGRAFAKAARTVSAASEHDWEDKKLPASRDMNNSPESPIPQPPSPEVQAKQQQQSMDYSPADSTSTTSSTYSPSNKSKESSQRPRAAPQSEPAPRPPPLSMAARAASVRLTDAVAAREAIGTFVKRTRHLFELFRLQAESVRRISVCSPTQCARAALWWFLKGRMGLEVAIRERPTTPRSQMLNDRDRQQAYSNLAKVYWLCEEIIPTLTGAPLDPEVAEVSQNLVSALTKLAMSMKRNGFLPPQDPFLPQTIDKSIWIEYPPLSQDMVALLTGNWGSGLTAMQHPMADLELLDAFPLGDTPDTFSFGRITADVFLMEQGRENQRLHFPCMVSTVRPQKQMGLVFVIASQDGSIQLPIQEHKNTGPVWEDVRWRNSTCTLDVRLPRGFKLVVQLTQNDFKMLYTMYDYASKLRTTLEPRSDEEVVFRNTLRSFQYLDSDPQSRYFPKEPISQCEVALFEKVYKESGPAGPRCWHTGFRIAVVTGPGTRTACGVNHSFPPPLPVQFGFFRGDGNSPAFSVKFDNGRQKGRMVMAFSDEKERVRFHSLLTGTALDHGEKVFADVPVKGFMISQSLREPTGMAPFSLMPWKSGKVVNDEFSLDGEEPPTVLADRLRIVLEYQHGTITDRINVAPGELRMRLEVSNAKVLRLLRQPQQDITMAVSEPQVPKELPRNMAIALQTIKTNQTIRTIEFNNLKDLHAFQAAVTGFEVIFDALAVTFAIQRRRMVVPIHKKWEAGYTRIQVVRQEDKQLQLLAFFEDFTHGHCMNFVLKGTDVYETFHRGSKLGIRFVDAKFPLPRLPADKDGDFDDMAFVCLDLPDLPGEHDDISIMFENEEDRDRLCQCLPAPIKGSSKLSSRLK